MSEEEQIVPEIIETPVTPMTPMPPIEEPKKSNAGKIIGIIAVIVLCCCALVSAAIIYFFIYAGIWVWNNF